MQNNRTWIGKKLCGVLGEGQRSEGADAQENHDYGEAWRDMRVSSFTDLIILKLLRVKQIEDNQGKTLVMEGLDANYLDMINCSVFALIKFMEKAA